MKKVGVPRTPTARASAMSCSIHAIASAEGMARAFATSSPAFSAAAHAASILPSCQSGWASSRSEEHTSELQSLMRISYAIFCLKKKKQQNKLNQVTYYKNQYTPDNNSNGRHQ